jgi:solute carrier family 25 phosphate transporter 3
VATAASAFSNALKQMDYRYFVAGGVCAATSHGITTPMDVVKTRMQANPKLYADKGIVQATMSIVKSDGASALLGGLGPTVVGYGIEGAMKFGVYEVLKPVVLQLMSIMTTTTTTSSSSSDAPRDANKSAAYIIASVVAGAVASAFLCPMESTRIRVVTSSDYKDQGLFTALPKLVRDEGLLSLFGGMYAMLAKQVPYTMAKQVSFDVFAGHLYTYFGSNSSENKLWNTWSGDSVKWMVSITAAFLASIFACIFSQPGDMILTETYKGASGKSFSQIVKDIYATDGISSFFTGTGARILHVGMIITSQLVIYDLVKQSLGLPATGSH